MSIRPRFRTALLLALPQPVLALANATPRSWHDSRA